MNFDVVSHRVIGCALEVHRALGPGLLEFTYEACVAYELSLAGLSFQRQTPVPVRYKGVQLECGYRIDLLVEDKVVVELKAVAAVLPVHHAQLLTYMRLSGRRISLLMNFNVTILKQGLKRFVL